MENTTVDDQTPSSMETTSNVTRVCVSPYMDAQGVTDSYMYKMELRGSSHTSLSDPEKEESERRAREIYDKSLWSVTGDSSYQACDHRAKLAIACTVANTFSKEGYEFEFCTPVIWNDDDKAVSPTSNMEPQSAQSAAEAEGA